MTQDVLAAIRGIATGVLALATAIAVAYAMSATVGPQPGSCDEDDVACLPGFAAIAVVLLVIVIVVPLVSPLFAWILRLPRPLFYALPGVFADGLAFASGAVHPAVLVSLAMLPYAGLAVLLRRARTAPLLGR